MSEDKDKKTSYTPAPEVPQDLMERFTTMMSVLTGAITMTEGAHRMKLSRVQTQNLLHKALTGFVDGLSPKLPGPRPRSEQERKLELENSRLKKENDSLQARVETIERMLGVASELITGRAKIRSRTPKRPTAKSKTMTGDEKVEDEDARRLERANELRGLGLNAALAAALAGKGASTLRRWRKRGVPRRLSRPRKSVDRALVACVDRHVRNLRGLVGAESIRRSIPGVSRRQAAAIKRETLTSIERERIEQSERVVITTVGVVRGFDQMYVQTTQGQQLLLFSADGSVPYRTSVLRTERYDERSVAAAVAHDFDEHGAPLVWRADRHRSHDAPAVRDVLARHGVLCLHGPPRHPGFYGQMERQNGEHRRWLDDLGVVDPELLDDETMRMLTSLNTQWKRPTLGWRTAHDVWAERTELMVDRVELREEVQDRAARIAIHAERAIAPDVVERLAIEQTLIKRGFLRREAGGWC